MVALLKIKSENISIISKSEQKIKLNEYILLAVDFKDKIVIKNENINLANRYNYENDEIRKELRDVKVSIKDEKIETESINGGFNSINITTFSRTFGFENNDLKKKLYGFKIQL